MPGIRARPLTRAATAPAVAAVMALWGLAVTLGAAQSGAQEPPGKDVCLACHGDPGAVSSAGRSVAVDEARFGGSVHGFLGMACIDCHTDVAAAQEFPHAERLAPVQCGLCHDAPVAAYDRSVHARARRERVSSVAATCVDCHTTHDIRPASDPDSPTYALNVPATCARCHGSAEVIAAGGISIGNVPALYEDSIHGRAVSRAGLLVAPTCTSCHDSHDIREKSDVESRVHHANVPATCGRCHEGILRVYGEGVHGSGLASGNGSVPVCSDCHSAHGIQRAEVSGWQLDVIGECGTCHTDQMRTYRDTFHGQVTSLGFTRVATCAACHGSHAIYPKDDPRSTISSAQLLQTCRQCHATATEGFTRYDPHADKHDAKRNPTLYWARVGMTWLLVGTFGFFGLHAMLWLPRGFIAKRRKAREQTTATQPDEPAPDEPEI
jgi:hypothetical protein